MRFYGIYCCEIKGGELVWSTVSKSVDVKDANDRTVLWYSLVLLMIIVAAGVPPSCNGKHLFAEH